MQPLEVGAAETDLLQYGFRQSVGPRARRHAYCRATLYDCSVEQPVRRRHREEDADLTATTGLAKDRHVAGIAAKAIDILTHPMQRSDEVENPGIARGAPKPGRLYLLNAESRKC